MKLGTHIAMVDGREGTIVYNGLDGVGVKWGLHDPKMEDFQGTSGGCVPVARDSPAIASDWPWKPDAMLRDDYPRAGLPCVGSDFVVIGG